MTSTLLHEVAFPCMQDGAHCRMVALLSWLSHGTTPRQGPISPHIKSGLTAAFGHAWTHMHGTACTHTCTSEARRRHPPTPLHAHGICLREQMQARRRKRGLGRSSGARPRQQGTARSKSPGLRLPASTRVTRPWDPRALVPPMPPAGTAAAAGRARPCRWRHQQRQRSHSRLRRRPRRWPKLRRPRLQSCWASCSST
jgi:hypothetical protein